MAAADQLAFGLRRWHPHFLKQIFFLTLAAGIMALWLLATVHHIISAPK